MSVESLISALSPVAYWKLDDAGLPLVNSGTGGSALDFTDENGAPSQYEYEAQPIYLRDSHTAVGTLSDWFEFSAPAPTLFSGTDPTFVAGGWFQATATDFGGGDLWYAFGDTTSQFFTVWVEFDGVFLQLQDDTGADDVAELHAPAALLDGRAHFIAVAVDATDAYIWVDGTLKATAARAGGAYSGDWWLENFNGYDPVNFTYWSDCFLAPLGSFDGQYAVDIFEAGGFRFAQPGDERATGGTITYDGQDVIHTFSANGTFTPDFALLVDGVVVGSGGPGGFAADRTAGGGAGGQVVPFSQIVSSPTAVVVGVGPNGSTVSGGGTNGQSSSFGATVALGGGKGGGTTAGTASGGTGTATGGGGQHGGSGGAGTEFNGGNGYNSGSASLNFGGGGGAGAGGPGGNATATSAFPATAGAGGVGEIWRGVYYGGGGGGGSQQNNANSYTGGQGGNGGGGAGASEETSTPPGDGVDGLGGGGGGGAAGTGTVQQGGDGGDGVVIVRYSVSDPIGYVEVSEEDDDVAAVGRLIIDPSFIGDGADPLRSTWFKNTAQFTRPIGLSDGVMMAAIWNAAMWNTRVGNIDATEGDDTITASGSQPVAGYIDATEGDDTITASGFVRPTGSAAWTEEDDDLAAVGLSGNQGTAAWTEEDDTLDAVGAAIHLFIDPMTIDGASDVVGPAAVEFFDPGAPQDIDVGTIDALTPVAGPLAIEFVTEPNPLYGWLYAADGVTLLSTLDDALEPTWLDPRNGVGTGTIVVPRDSPDAALLTPGRFVRCFYYGVEAFTFVINRHPADEQANPGEEADEEVTASGPGFIAAGDVAKILPYGGVDNALIPQKRIYSFASPDLPTAGSWPPTSYQQSRADEVDPVRYQAVEIVTDLLFSDDVVEIVNVPAPAEWPIDESYWIWGQADSQPVGLNFFRKTFYLSAQTQVKIIATGDNYYTVFLDGTPILGEDEVESCWREWREVELTLNAGEHTFASFVYNIPWPPEFSNPGGFMLACYTFDHQDNPVTVLCVTDSTWSSLAYPAYEPGWTTGEILHDMLAEAQARSSVPWLSWGFTTAVDSAGAPWHGADVDESLPYVPSFAVPIGSSIPDALDAFVDQGWIDYRGRPGMIVEAFNQGTGGVHTGVTFEIGVNCRDQSTAAPDELPVNSLLVKFPGGYMIVDDAAAIIADGVRREGFITVDASNELDAERRGRIALAEMRNPDPAVVIEIEPLDESQRPYFAFLPGDWVWCNARDGTLVEYQVQTITVRPGPNGFPMERVELNRRPRVRERTVEQLLQSLGTGVVGDFRSDPLATTGAVRKRLYTGA